jgi:ECF subfamily RNA polymerase sigma-24 factor
VLEELSEVLPDKGSIPGEENELSGLIDSFLATLKPEIRNIFMRRYWFMDSVSEIAEESGFGLSKVKMSLSRTREQLKLFLEQEGYRL